MSCRKHDDRLSALVELAETLQSRLQDLSTSHQQLQEQFNALHAEHAALRDAARAVAEERDRLRQRAAELEAANNRLTDMLWGRRTERRSESSLQQHLDFGDDPEPGEAAGQEVIEAQSPWEAASDEELLARLKARRKARQKAKASREEFPSHIERRERTIDLSDEEKVGLTLIGVKVSERLRFEKPNVFVEQIRRPQYVVEGQVDQGVKAAPAPLAIVEGCKYDFSVIAAMVGMKWGFHHPTYRQQDWFAQCGWFPSRSTTNDLFNYAVEAIQPLYQEMWRLLLAEPILLGDDTSLTVLLRGALDAKELEPLSSRKGGRGQELPGSATSYAWLYTGLDGTAPYNIFHWSLTHQNAVIDGHLGTFRGVFVGDACGANARVEQRSAGRIRHAACNTHARREFVKAETNDPILASKGLAFYRRLYEVEERGKTLDDAGRLRLRQAEAVPLWKAMDLWLQSAEAKRAFPKSAIGQALGYLRNHGAALRLYLSDGRVPIDNDQSEQTIRPLTVGRANWLFLGHPRAAPGRMQLYSIVSSAHRHHLMLQDYLEDVLTKLADAQQNHPVDLAAGASYLAELLPDRWAAAHASSVRQGRQEERQRVWDVKRARRARARIKARQQAANLS